MCTNLDFIRCIAADPRYPAGDTTTKFVEGVDYAPHAGTRLLLLTGCCSSVAVWMWACVCCCVPVHRARPCAHACSRPPPPPAPIHPHTAVEFLDAGLQTTVQDYPGRVALWSVGVPPSGPMDDLSHRLANALVGRPAWARGWLAGA